MMNETALVFTERKCINVSQLGGCVCVCVPKTYGMFNREIECSKINFRSKAQIWGCRLNAFPPFEMCRNAQNRRTLIPFHAEYVYTVLMCACIHGHQLYCEFTCGQWQARPWLSVIIRHYRNNTSVMLFDQV